MHKEEKLFFIVADGKCTRCNLLFKQKAVFTQRSASRQHRIPVPSMLRRLVSVALPVERRDEKNAFIRGKSLPSHETSAPLCEKKVFLPAHQGSSVGNEMMQWIC